jgi:hypothetical protein
VRRSGPPRGSPGGRPDQAGLAFGRRAGEALALGRGRRARRVPGTVPIVVSLRYGEADLYGEAAFWSRGRGEGGVVGGGDGADDRQAEAVVAVVLKGAVTKSLEGLEQSVDLRPAGRRRCDS